MAKMRQNRHQCIFGVISFHSGVYFGKKKVECNNCSIGDNGGVSRILPRYNKNYVSLWTVFGTGLPGLNLYYSTI